MTISKEILLKRKEEIVADYNKLVEEIRKGEQSLKTMRDNLSALAGALQQTDLFIKQIEDDEKYLRDKIIKFREDELHHKDIAYENGATKKGIYSFLDKVIKTGSKIAINISEKI